MKKQKWVFRPSLIEQFVFHAVQYYLAANPKFDLISNLEKFKSYLVEAVVVNHFQRYYPTYYIKSEGEVDVAYVHEGKFWPIEVKWTQQLRPKDLKQISKYSNALILAKEDMETEINGIPVQNIAEYLYELNPA